MSDWKIYAQLVIGILGLLVLGLYFMHWWEMLFLFFAFGINNRLRMRSDRQAGRCQEPIPAKGSK
jgi:hypothetical protein